MTFELLTGILFMLSYIIFGFSIDFIISIIFVSMAIIIIISDYQTMIIPDEVLIFSGISILICQFISGGLNLIINSLISGIISFGIMLLIKMFGDYLFKKESMGGGDIKLMFIFGLVFGWQMSIISIFLASFIALPISLILYFKNKGNIIPFGPFLCISGLIILLGKIDFNLILNLLTK
jgi:leader peptidase (prepilin peptidase) / N-methyltransferase